MSYGRSAFKWQRESRVKGDYHATDPKDIDRYRAEELGKCYASPVYFISTYCKIYDSVMKDWITFELWPEQANVIQMMEREQLLVILKARQLGISWLALCFALWNIIYRPIAAVTIFSRREPEAIYMAGSERLRGIFNHLPEWMKTGYETKTDNGREWILSNGSAVRAFPTSAGDGYVSTFAFVDEADLTPDLNRLMRAVKPTIDNGGKLVLLSRVDKSVPDSEFKQVYRGAISGENGWFPVFLPWHVHPARTKEWYEAQKKDIQSRTGSLDDLYEQYPATADEALAPKILDKRIPPMWIGLCYQAAKQVIDSKAPSLMALKIYKKPEFGRRYVLGADPAEGNPTSDDSSLTVVDVETGEECASFSGKYEPAIFGSYIIQIALYYNYACAMIERNNHGHAVIQFLEEHGRRVRLLPGHDSEVHKTGKKAAARKKRKKAGWLSSKLGKSLLYTVAADFFRVSSGIEVEGATPKKVLHTRETLDQLQSIEAASLRAPEGFMDDLADSFALAQAGRSFLLTSGKGGVLVMSSAKGWGL